MDGPAGPWHLIALFNWQENTQDLHFQLNKFFLDPQTEYIARSFWEGKSYRISTGSLVFSAVPAHGVVLLALRDNSLKQPNYVGGNLHVSQGMEIKNWVTTYGKVELRLARPGPTDGEVDIFLPGLPESASLNDEPLSWLPMDHGIQRFPVRFDKSGKLIIEWKSTVS
jgi:hypothetical protein